MQRLTGKGERSLEYRVQSTENNCEKGQRGKDNRLWTTVNGQRSTVKSWEFCFNTCDSRDTWSFGSGLTPRITGIYTYFIMPWIIFLDTCDSRDTWRINCFNLLFYLSTWLDGWLCRRVYRVQLPCCVCLSTWLYGLNCCYAGRDSVCVKSVDF